MFEKNKQCSSVSLPALSLLDSTQFGALIVENDRIHCPFEFAAGSV